jgi:hypothetical protein
MSDHPVYFGVLMSFVLGLGLITPPVGAVFYVGCAVGRVSMEELLRNAAPLPRDAGRAHRADRLSAADPVPAVRRRLISRI